MGNLLYYIIFYISIISAFFPVIFSFKNRRTFNKQLNVLFIYVIISLFVEVISAALGKTVDLITLAFTILEYTLIAYIFWIELEKKVFRNIIYVTSALFFGALTFSILYLNNLDRTDDIASAIEGFIIMILGITYFFKVFSDLNIPRLTDHYYFWLNSAFLLYFSTSLFLFIFKSYIRSLSIDGATSLWLIHLLINIIYNILLTIGICKHRTT